MGNNNIEKSNESLIGELFELNEMVGDGTFVNTNIFDENSISVPMHLSSQSSLSSPPSRLSSPSLNLSPNILYQEDDQEKNQEDDQYNSNNNAQDDQGNTQKNLLEDAQNITSNNTGSAYIETYISSDIICESEMKEHKNVGECQIELDHGIDDNLQISFDNDILAEKIKADIVDDGLEIPSNNNTLEEDVESLIISDIHLFFNIIEEEIITNAQSNDDRANNNNTLEEIIINVSSNDDRANNNNNNPEEMITNASSVHHITEKMFNNISIETPIIPHINIDHIDPQTITDIKNIDVEHQINNSINDRSNQELNNNIVVSDITTRKHRINKKINKKITSHIADDVIDIPQIETYLAPDIKSNNKQKRPSNRKRTSTHRKQMYNKDHITATLILNDQELSNDINIDRRCTSVNTPMTFTHICNTSTTQHPSHGNVYLSLCPGKKNSRWNRDLIDDINAIKSHGIDVIFSLIEWSEIRSLGIDSYPLIAQQHGLEFYQLSIKDRGSPSKSEIDAFVPFMLMQLNMGKNILIHCRVGLGRAGTVCACLLAHYGYNDEQVLSEIRNRRTGAIQTRRQELFISKYIERLRQNNYTPSI